MEQRNIAINNWYASSATEDTLFISSVVEFGLVLRDSAYKETASLEAIIERLEQLNSVEDNPYKSEFLVLVKKYQAMD